MRYIIKTPHGYIGRDGTSGIREDAKKYNSRGTAIRAMNHFKIVYAYGNMSVEMY